MADNVIYDLAARYSVGDTLNRSLQNYKELFLN